MKLSNTFRRVRDMTPSDGRAMQLLDNVFETVIELLDDESEDKNRYTILERGLFLKSLHKWCRENPDEPARLLTIRPWDESTDDNQTQGFVEAIRREMIPVIERQFDESVLFTQLDSEVFALFLPPDQGSFVTNEFDWESKLEGLNTSLENATTLSFHFKSARWPRDASTAITLLDVATPRETDVTQIPFPATNEPEIEDSLDSVLDTDIGRKVEEKLPTAIRDKLPLRRFLN